MKIQETMLGVFIILLTFFAVNLPQCEEDRTATPRPIKLEVIDIQTEIESIEVIK